ncbi:para-aminobenzoate synthetase component 1/para-aminobenzoate synthetase/4-amino-4-deoxychorismate lyase [Sphingobium sp. B1D7B]|uniref:aminodeoxychorismate synthase component I n=1 Tax=Sphingobium sp. B1D7B TaxID=2940578 RepID=UPI002224AA89|nr:aminodeoxychorismate synthase component I [Sphingobium sp. B1D7B]MCW2403996.1 para-aminobenzoate synthetase component 1/para-aminobenzoate synthetase/4-amino-4-deoxychorismate lyase [Sphingobium sp. B1D7B]
MTRLALPISSDAPFVLLDDARADGSGSATLFRDPCDIIRADRLADVLPALARVEAAVKTGLHAAGYLSYAAGHAFEARLNGCVPREGDAGPLLWFGLFDALQPIAADAVDALLPETPVTIGPIEPMISRADYGRAIGTVLDYIRAGDIYQANLTFPARVAIDGNPLAAYRAIRPRAAAGHGALLRHDDRHVLSFSPESFFTLADGMVTTRPMKGTARRDADPDRDAAAARDLASDPKQRAENLMIVDLLRNDISRVTEPGSVAVPALFHVEHYPTVHQMISVVEGRLQPQLGPADVLRALFPCGSITGAPKLRAMEIIREVERFGRGLYTGSIGHIAPDGTARFNVAIRTIVLEKDAEAGIVGLGSGIVADSQPEAEWQECLDKGRFLAVGENVL